MSEVRTEKMIDEGAVDDERARRLHESQNEALEMQFLQDKVTKHVLILGKVGTGKSALNGCIRGRKNEKCNQWRDGTNNNQIRVCNFGNCILNLYDTVGFRGDWKADSKLLLELQNWREFRQKNLNLVFLCFSATRYSEAEDSIISMLAALTTPEFRSIIRVVITHFSEHVRIDGGVDAFKAHVQSKLAPLLGSDKIEQKIIYMDLMDPFRFQLEAGHQILTEWVDNQLRLHAQIMATRDEDAVDSDKMLAYHPVVQYLRVYWLEIVFWLIVMCLMYLYWAYVQELREVKRLAMEIQECRKSIIVKPHTWVDILRKPIDWVRTRVTPPDIPQQLNDTNIVGNTTHLSH